MSDSEALEQRANADWLLVAERSTSREPSTGHSSTAGSSQVQGAESTASVQGSNEGSSTSTGTSSAQHDPHLVSPSRHPSSLFKGIYLNLANGGGNGQQRKQQ